jgi:phosphatidate cytidylyltransferase
MAASELGKRVASALVLAPVAVACIWFGDAALAALVACAAAAGAWEFYRMVAGAGAGVRPFARTGIAIAGVLPILVHAQTLGVVRVPLTAGVFLTLALLGASVWRRGVDGRPLLAVATTLLGVAYVAVPLSYGYALRNFPYAVGRAAGTAVLLLPVLGTWASDVGAYFAGRAIRGPKLLPSVSPGKTVAGAVGGLVATAVVAVLYERYALRPYAQLAFLPGRALAFGLAVSAAAQLGDLVESLLKREAGVKDSSNLIPGHGGVLDRVDSLLFVLPVSYVLLGALLIPALGVVR